MKNIGIIGLGRMGSGMSERLLSKNVKVIVYNRTKEKTKALEKKGAIGSYSIQEFSSKLGEEKIAWLMLPAGSVSEKVIEELLVFFNKGDIIISGANEFYENAKKYQKMCSKRGVYFLDVGVSGGVYGKDKGYVLSIGGDKTAFKRAEGFFKLLSPKSGYGYFGDSGSGFFVKSVHNMVEYIYLEGLAEGIEALNKFDNKIDYKKAFSIWKQGSIIESLLVTNAFNALNRKDFEKITPEISSVSIDELKQTKRAIEANMPAFDSAVSLREDKSSKMRLGKRLIASIRREFGGHDVGKK